LNGGWFWDVGHPSGETVVKFFRNSKVETKWIGRFFFEIYLKKSICYFCVWWNGDVIKNSIIFQNQLDYIVMFHNKNSLNVNICFIRTYVNLCIICFIYFFIIWVKKNRFRVRGVCCEAETDSSCMCRQDLVNLFNFLRFSPFLVSFAV